MHPQNKVIYDEFVGRVEIVMMFESFQQTACEYLSISVVKKKKQKNINEQNISNCSKSCGLS